jgi:long-chain fatty acid transport protein
VNSAWCFGVGIQHQATKTFTWGVSTEYMYGGTLDTNLQSNPVVLGGRGNVVGSYEDTAALFLGLYGSWKF